jgi:hypothetical protein
MAPWHRARSTCSPTRSLLRSEPEGIPLFFSEVHGHIEYLPIAKLPVVCVVARVGVSSMGD